MLVSFAADCRTPGRAAAFLDQNYWRGRTWGPHHQLMYWSLARYDHLPGERLEGGGDSGWRFQV